MRRISCITAAFRPAWYPVGLHVRGDRCRGEGSSRGERGDVHARLFCESDRCVMNRGMEEKIYILYESSTKKKNPRKSRRTVRTRARATKSAALADGQTNGARATGKLVSDGRRRRRAHAGSDLRHRRRRSVENRTGNIAPARRAYNIFIYIHSQPPDPFPRSPLTATTVRVPDLSPASDRAGIYRVHRHRYHY